MGAPKNIELKLKITTVLGKVLIINRGTKPQNMFQRLASTPLQESERRN